MLSSSKFSRTLLPIIVFLTVFMFHFVWLGLFPEHNPIQDRWADLDSVSPSWLTTYTETQSYWFGFSYALSLTFIAIILRQYHEQQFCTAKNIALGSITISGIWSVVGCYLIGCCGSPMLSVYLSLFGATFLTIAKPLIALITIISISVSWWWMKRSYQTNLASLASSPKACKSECDCN